MELHMVFNGVSPWAAEGTTDANRRAVEGTPESWRYWRCARCMGHISRTQLVLVVLAKAMNAAMAVTVVQKGISLSVTSKLR